MNVLGRGAATLGLTRGPYICHFGAVRRLMHGPFIRQLTDKYNDPYIHRLTDKYTNFFTIACFGCLPGWGASKIGTIQLGHAYLAKFMTIQTKMSYNCSMIHKSHPDNSQDTIQTKTTAPRHCRHPGHRPILLSGSRRCRRSRIPPHQHVLIEFA
jgi:hypothetical protein